MNKADQIERVAQAIRIRNPVGAAQTAEVAVEVLGDKIERMIVRIRLLQVSGKAVTIRGSICADDGTELQQLVSGTLIDPRDTYDVVLRP